MGRTARQRSRRKANDRIIYPQASGLLRALPVGLVRAGARITMASRSILIISFDFPPYQSSSGVLRIVSFAREFRARGWSVSILTANRSDDAASSPENEQLIPEGCRIVRTRAFDAARTFAIAGKYPGLLEIPDRYSSWIPGAFWGGIRHLRRFPATHILSSYPIASSHVIAWLLARYSGLPWIADFRDPMLLEGHPETATRRRAHSWVERKTINNCQLAVFTNEAARDSYVKKYPKKDQRALCVVENGYDEIVFEKAETQAASTPSRASDDALHLLHSGTIYPDHRNPVALFAALASLHRKGVFASRGIRLKLRATGYEAHYRSLIAREFPQLRDSIEFAPSTDYISSIAETLTCDGLLILQGATCNDQVPAKLYECVRARRPILALVDPHGETARLLTLMGITEQASMTDSIAIEELISRFIEASERRSLDAFLPSVDGHSLARRHRGQELVEAVEACA